MACVSSLTAVLADAVTMGHRSSGREVEHASALLGARGPWDRHTCDLAFWVAEHEHQRGLYGVARGLLERVLDARRRLLGESHPDTLTSMSNLASTLRAQGDLTGARWMHERVLDVRYRALGENHPDTLASRHNHALTLRAQGDLAGARGWLERVLEAGRRVLGEDHPDTLKSMSNLAEMLWAQGDFAGARGWNEFVLEARRRVLGEDHPETLASINNLAATLWAQGVSPARVDCRNACSRYGAGRSARITRTHSRA